MTDSLLDDRAVDQVGKDIWRPGAGRPDDPVGGESLAIHLDTTITRVGRATDEARALCCGIRGHGTDRQLRLETQPSGS